MRSFKRSWLQAGQHINCHTANDGLWLRNHRSSAMEGSANKANKPTSNDSHSTHCAYAPWARVSLDISGPHNPHLMLINNRQQHLLAAQWNCTINSAESRRGAQLLFLAITNRMPLNLEMQKKNQTKSHSQAQWNQFWKSAHENNCKKSLNKPETKSATHKTDSAIDELHSKVASKAEQNTEKYRKKITKN